MKSDHALTIILFFVSLSGCSGTLEGVDARLTSEMPRDVSSEGADAGVCAGACDAGAMEILSDDASSGVADAEEGRDDGDAMDQPDFGEVSVDMADMPDETPEREDTCEVDEALGERSDAAPMAQGSLSIRDFKRDRAIFEDVPGHEKG